MLLIAPKEMELGPGLKRLAWTSRIRLKTLILQTRFIRPPKDGRRQIRIAGISIHCQAMQILKETSPIGVIGRGKKQSSSLHTVECGRQSGTLQKEAPCVTITYLVLPC